MVTVTIHSSASPARNTGPRLSSATTSIMAAPESDLVPPAQAPRTVDTGGLGTRRPAPSGLGQVRGGVRSRGGAAEAGLPFSPFPGPGPFRPEAPGWPDRKGLECHRLGPASHGLALGCGRFPRHRPAEPGAQPWEVWCCGKRTRLSVPRPPRPDPGAVPFGLAPQAPPLSAGPVVALWPGELIIAAQ